MSSYFPEHKIQKFNYFEEINDIRASLAKSRDLWTDARQSLTLNYDKEWKRPRDICDNPVFVDGKPSRFDALQGSLEDCWLVAGIEVITLNDELINFVVPPGQSFNHNYVGAFHFRIWHFGSWYDVVVDDRLPVFRKNQQLAYIHSMRRDIFWAALLEKAYSKVYHDTRTNLYYIDDVGSGGYTMDSLQDFSGGIVETVLTHRPPAAIKWFINEVFSKKALMCCKRFDKIKPDLGLLSEHAYIVSGIWKCSDDDPDYPGLYLVRVMNPWGHREWQGEWRDDHYYLWRQIDQKIKQRLNFVDRDDGEFWMSEEDFVKYFEKLFISHLGPGQYLASHRGGENRRAWTTQAISGEWVRDISAGGAYSLTRHKNPQYMLLVEIPHGTYSETVGKVDVVIELVQKLKYGRFIRSGIGFFVYSLKHLYHPPMPLDKEFFRNNRALNDYPNFVMSSGRCFVLSMRLEEGRYCILPCTEVENDNAYFLLRVYCQSPVSLSLINHDKISKKCPTEEQTPNESDECLEKLFNDIAQGQEEIDCFGLKEILETAMTNPSRSYFDLIPSLFNFIGDIFENQFSLRSYNVCDTEDVVFTKDECRSMIAMLDDNHSGKLSFSEFNNLWNKISFWIKVYKQHRDETEGYLTVPQLRDALSAIGYDLNKRTVHSLVYVYANDQGHIFLTDFILCGVTLETVLSLCQKEDVEDVNTITFTLEEWVKNTLIL